MRYHKSGIGEKASELGIIEGAPVETSMQSTEPPMQSTGPPKTDAGVEKKTIDKPEVLLIIRKLYS